MPSSPEHLQWTTDADELFCSFETGFLLCSCSRLAILHQSIFLYVHVQLVFFSQSVLTQQRKLPPPWYWDLLSNSICSPLCLLFSPQL